MHNTSMTTTPFRQIADLPGPRGWPVLGNVPQLNPDTVHQTLENWARQYGTFFQLRFGPRQALIVSDSATVTALLRERPERFRRPQRSRDVSKEMGLKTGVFSAEGDDWQRQRRMVMASFSPGHVRAYFASLQTVTQRLHQRWRKAAHSRATIPLQPDLMRYTVDAIAGLAFGADVNTLESDDDIIQQHLDKIFPALFKRTFSIVPYWRWLRLPVDRQLDRSVAAINVAIDEFIAQARARLEKDPGLREHPGNLLEAMIAAADLPGSGVDDTAVAGNVLTMLLAGEDTTANTLAWMIYLLQRNPDALARARNEVLRLAPDPAAFTPEQMASLDYLDACAQETMRLKPVAPNLPVEANVDTVVGDIAVPAGTLVWSLLRLNCLDDKNFGRAAEFLPERWLATEPVADGGNHAANTTANKRVAMPFGSGPRVCPGRYLALLEIKMAMAMLLSQFDIQSVDTPDGQEAKELMSFTMTPVGLTMKLQARQWASVQPEN